MLKVHSAEDSKFDINWVSENRPMVMLNRSYVERHEPTHSGVSIVVDTPAKDGWLMEFGHCEDGFLYVGDFKYNGELYEVVPFEVAIRVLQHNTERVLGLDRPKQPSYN